MMSEGKVEFRVKVSRGLTEGVSSLPPTSAGWEVRAVAEPLTKAAVWGLEGYDRVIVLDPDVLILVSLPWRHSSAPTSGGFFLTALLPMLSHSLFLCDDWPLIQSSVSALVPR
jgi:hypothetical protein